MRANTIKRFALFIVPALLFSAACLCTSLPGQLNDISEFAGELQELEGTLQSPEMQATLEAVGTAVFDEDFQATAEAAMEDLPEFGGDTTFPLPETYDQVNVMGAGTDSEILVFTTDLSVAQVTEFYRNRFTQQGLTENTASSVEMGGLSFLEFSGAPNGKLIYVSVAGDEGTGQTAVTVSYGQ